MGVGKEISNTYHVFKLALDKLNWTYATEGPILRDQDVHTPWRTRNISDFADHLVENHMEYLKNNDCYPRNHACVYIAFSYMLPYKSIFMNNEIWHTKRFTREEETQFEQSIINSYKDLEKTKSLPE